MLRFQPVKTNQEVVKTRWIESMPASNIGENSPIEFYIAGNGDDYIDLKKTILSVKFKVVKEDGSFLTMNDRVAPINLTLHSLFSEVNLSLQNVQTSRGVGTNYPYKAYLDVLLNYGAGVKRSWLQCQGYYKDESGHMNEGDPLIGGNSGLTERFGVVWNGTSAVICGMEGPLMLDICQQELPIPNGVDIKIKMWPSQHKFLLMSNADNASYKVVITEAVMKVCKVTPTPQMMIKNEQHFSKTTAKYPYLRSEITTRTIQSGSHNVQLDDVFGKHVPCHLILGLLGENNYHGSYKRNPFNFEHFKVNEIGTYVNGEPLPTDPIKVSYALRDILTTSAYNALFTGFSGEYFGSDIQLKDFHGGYAIYVINLNGANQSNGEMPAARTGNLKVCLKFDEPLKQNVILMLYAVFPDYIQIDQTRNIILG